MGKRPGRPRLAEVPATQIVTFRCTPAQRRELQRVADAAGLRLSTVIRDAVDDWADDRRDRGFRITVK